MKGRTLVIISILVAAAICAAAYLYVQSTAKNPTPAAGDDSGSVNYQMNAAALANIGADIPDLAHAVAFGAGVPEDSRAMLQSKIDDVRTRLTADHARADDWFTLGVLYDGANDFDAARVVWEFLGKVIDPPAVAVVYDNLGKLYKFELKDFPKSETYFMDSIQANPDSVTPYMELFELYRYLYKTDTSAAVDIALEAGKKFPDNPDPYTQLGEYYRDKGQFAKAKDALTEALHRAEAAGDTALISGLNQEINGLPR